MSDRTEMTVTMKVTPAQGLALQAMFDHWNKMAAWGCSRPISFYVDGDGNFKPEAKVEFKGSIPKLTERLRKKAVCFDRGNEELHFDFDSIGWALLEEANSQPLHTESDQ